jgi:cytochrome P450
MSNGDHQQMREATSLELSPERMAAWQQTLECEARRLLVQLGAARDVDLLAVYGRPLCKTAAVAVTGADPGDADRLTALARMASAAVADPNDAGARIRSRRAGTELRYSLGPGPSSLRGAGFVAFSQTLPSLLANMWWALARQPEAFSTLRDTGLRTTAVDELLRYAGVPNTLYRVAALDAHVCGVHVRAGERILLRLGAAQHDPEAYANPEELDFNRTGPLPLTLGLGDHSCVGAGLIRMAVTVTTGALVARFESMRLAEDPEWEGGEGFRTPKSLRVVVVQ